MANDIDITSYTAIGVGISTLLLERKFSLVELIQQYVSSTFVGWNIIYNVLARNIYGVTTLELAYLIITAKFSKL